MTTSNPSAPAPSRRIASIDVLRGIVMIVMALDHARDYFGYLPQDPLDLSRTSVALYATRWITHFCAPVFVLLAGTSAWLHGRRLLQAAGERGGRAALARFLVSRGLWLIVLELTIVNFGWMSTFQWLNWQVIAVIGLSMIVLGGLVFLPVRVVGAIGLAIVGLHDFLHPIQPADLGGCGGPWIFLHEGSMRGGGIPSWFGVRVLVVYAALPWIGLMAAGYALGAWIDVEPPVRRRRLARLGLLLVVLFVGLRALNLFGDPVPWERQETPVFTVLSFLNAEKYPPSLLFLCMTLGPALLLLAWLDRLDQDGRLPRTSGVLATYGRVPLFYYVAHIYVLSFGASVTYYFQAGHFLTLWDVFRFQGAPEWYGHGLPVVYLAWAGAVALLWIPCRWYADLKRRKRSVWLSYL